MKYLFVLILSIIGKCYGQFTPTIITEFVEEFIIAKNKPDYSKLEHYLVLREDLQSGTVELVKTYIEDFNNELSALKDYRIVPRLELHNDLLENKKIIYNGEGRVFYLVSGNEVKMFFILENNKIISFFGHFQKRENEMVYPVMLPNL
ncbi:MAG: hypothetical protein CMC08_03010 [Flavobacteriaceae bacterium]|nr:hypothetical protein [Flavobacteriaceae bacterium]|tara:strand:+ start:751 stop:1194 length:444 start_codon:yes stop_codon:yes gene_type:complete